MSKARKNDEVNGNAMASALAVQRQLIRQAEQAARVEMSLERLDEDDIMVRSMRIVMPKMDGSDYMIVVNADTPDGAVCCFTSGVTFSEALSTCLARLENRSAKWVKDKYR